MGTGLGLSVVHNIVVAQGGEVTVESERGSGAVFSIRLPARYGTGAMNAWPEEAGQAT
jgi:signal transduction histidine kinase